MSGDARPVVSVLSSPLMRQHRGIAGKVRWHLNAQLVKRPWILNAAGATLTVVDAFGAPGDTLLTATICRHLRRRYPKLRLNCLTPNPDLLRHDPNIDVLNEPESVFSVWSWYPETAGRRDPDANILRETFARLGCADMPYDYRAEVYLSTDERRAAWARLGQPSQPVLTFHTRTNEPVKDWPIDRWRTALAALREDFHVVHLGDDREPVIDIDGVERFAGRLSLRESMSVVAHARVHVGADSFLMHAANGLQVPSVIIFGGSRTPSNLGYERNMNLFVEIPCGPCWIQRVNGETCTHDLACMTQIEPAQVVTAVRALVTAGRRG